MSIFFFDTSALAKRYIEEDGSSWVSETIAEYAQNSIFISHLTSIELISALARRNRDGTLTENNFNDSILLIDRHIASQYNVVQFNRVIEKQAINLLITHPLRAYDAIQLASCLFLQQLLIEKQINNFYFVSSDIRLLNIAQQVGVKHQNPTNPSNIW